MKENNSKTPIIIAMLLATAFVFRMIYEDVPNAMVQSVMCLTRNTIHISLMFLWVVSLRRRLTNKNVQKLMIIVGSLLLFWMLDKIVKWDFTGSQTHALVRYLWYGFYVGMLFVPTIGVFIIDYLGKPDNYLHSKKLNWLLVPPSIMLLAVFTNDLHQKVFVFYNGFINFDKQYGYDWVYYVVMSWFIVVGFYFVVSLVLKSRVPGSRKLQKMPVMIMVFAALFWIGYSMKLYDCDLTVTDCLIIVLLLESAIQSGLLPANIQYSELFNMTTVPMQILDKDYQPRYVSAGALPVNEQDLKKSENGSVQLGDYLLSSSPIKGGCVVWQDDIAQLNELKERLQDAMEQLGEENVILKAELEVAEKRAKADEQNQLYDRIAREVEPQLIKIDGMLNEIRRNPEKIHELISKIGVLGSYIKRRGNMLLLGDSAKKIPSRELEYSIHESNDNLRLAKIYTSLNSYGEGYVQLKYIVAAYDFYEMLIECMLDDLTAIMINLTCNNGVIKMNFQLGCRKCISPHILSGVTARYGSYTYEIMEEDIIIDLVISERGDTNDDIL